MVTVLAETAFRGHDLDEAKTKAAIARPGAQPGLPAERASTRSTICGAMPR